VKSPSRRGAYKGEKGKNLLAPSWGEGNETDSNRRRNLSKKHRIRLHGKKEKEEYEKNGWIGGAALTGRGDKGTHNGLDLGDRGRKWDRDPPAEPVPDQKKTE